MNGNSISILGWTEWALVHWNVVFIVTMSRLSHISSHINYFSPLLQTITFLLLFHISILHYFQHLCHSSSISSSSFYFDYSYPHSIIINMTLSLSFYTYFLTWNEIMYSKSHFSPKKAYFSLSLSLSLSLSIYIYIIYSFLMNHCIFVYNTILGQYNWVVCLIF